VISMGEEESKRTKRNHVPREVGLEPGCIELDDSEIVGVGPLVSFDRDGRGVDQPANVTERSLPSETG
jgi:hypothetical protein